MKADAEYAAYAGRRVLITGGLGFLGSALARGLTGAGARVRVLDSLLPHGGGSPRNVVDVATALDVVIEDVRSRDAVQRAVDGCEVVFHLAGPGGGGAAGGDWYTQLDIACIGTLNVLEAVRTGAPGARVVFASSHHVYGGPRVTPVAEDSPTNPHTLFGVHKLTGEKYVGLYMRTHGVDAVVARFVTIFGPRQHLAGAGAGTIGHMLDAALHGEDVLLFDGGAARQDLLFVDDAAASCAVLGMRPAASGLTVNVGTGVSTTLQEVGALLVAELGRGRIRELAGRAPDDDFVADVTSLRALDALPAPRPLDAAVAETVAWFTGGARA